MCMSRGDEYKLHAKGPCLLDYDEGLLPMHRPNSGVHIVDMFTMCSFLHQFIMMYVELSTGFLRITYIDGWLTISHSSNCHFSVSLGSLWSVDVTTVVAGIQPVLTILSCYLCRCFWVVGCVVISVFWFVLCCNKRNIVYIYFTAVTSVM